MTVIHIVAADAGTTRETTIVLVHEAPDGYWNLRGIELTQGRFACRIPAVSHELNGKKYEANDDAVARMRAHWNRDQRGWWRGYRSRWRATSTMISISTATLRGSEPTPIVARANDCERDR